MRRGSPCSPAALLRGLGDALRNAAQTLNQRTAWADGLKRRLGLQSLVRAVLARPVGDAARRDILASLNEHLVTDRVRDLARRGVDAPTFLVLHVERMGDLVASEPIARFLRALAPKGRIRWVAFPAYRDLLVHNPDIDEFIPVSTLAEGEDLCAAALRDAPDTVFVNCPLHRTSCAVTHRIFPNPANPLLTVFTFYAVGGLLEAFSLAAGLPRLTDAPRFHFRPGLALPEALRARRYAVLHCHASAAARDWGEEKWRGLAAALASDGVLVVEIGERRALDGAPGVLDLTGRRDLQSLAFVIAHAAVFVGVDSGFAHIANATRRPSVLLFGRLGNFGTYFPYSGDFAHSANWRILRAPGGGPARDIPLSAALSAVRALLEG